MRPRTLLAPLAFLLLAASASAQNTLTLNGSTSVTLPPGAGLIVSAKLKPLAVSGILYDSSAGPTDLFGESVPLGFTASLGVLAGPTTVPPSGTLLVSTLVPNNPLLLGSTFHLVAFAVDPADPNGLAFTNGASITIQKTTSAGPDQSAFVGSPVVLDGSANASDQGALGPGEILFWVLLSAPPGSHAQLSGFASLFPMFTPDVPGTYVAKATLSKNGVPYASDTVSVTAFGLASSSPVDGAIVPADSFFFAATLQPAAQIAAAALDGNPVNVGPFGTILVPNVAFAPGEVVRPILLQVAAADGTIATKRLTVLKGTAAPATVPLPESVRAQITPGGLQKVASLAKAQLDALDLNALIAALPNQQVADIFIATAYANPTGATYGAKNVSMVPTNQDVVVTATIANLKVNIAFSGTLFGIPWSAPGYIQSTLVTITTHATFPIVDGKLTLALSPAQVSIAGFSYDISGIPFDIDQAFTGTVYDAALAALQSAVGPILEGVLGSGFEIDLTHAAFPLFGKDLELQLRFESVAHTTGGVAATANGWLANLSPSTGPALQSFVGGGGALANFGPTAPGGAAFDVGTAVRADALNLFFSRLTSSGALTQPLDVLASGLGSGLGSTPFTAGELSSLLPSAGFELLPPAQIVHVRFSPAVAPVARVKTSGPSLFRLDAAGIRVDFTTQPAFAPVEVPVLSLVLDLSADLNAQFDASTASLSLTVATLDAKTALLSGLPSVDLPSLASGIQQIGTVLGGAIAGSLGAFTLPSFDFQGVVLSPVAVGPFGGAAGAAAWTKLQ